MAETTTEKRKQKRGRRFRPFLLVLAAVLALVTAAAYRDGTGFDAIRRRLNYGGAETGQVRYRYEISPKNRFAALGNRLVVLSDVSVCLLDQNGGEAWSAPVNMANPAMKFL